MISGRAPRNLSKVVKPRLMLLVTAIAGTLAFLTVITSIGVSPALQFSE